MIVTFCGHAHFLKSEEYEQKMLKLLEETVGDRSAEMYLGGYGGFDAFAYDCCKKYKQTHPNISLVFVTPYLTEAYQRDHLQNQEKRYDIILYPEIEDKPKRYAITYATDIWLRKRILWSLTYCTIGAARTRRTDMRKEKEK